MKPITNLVPMNTVLRKNASLYVSQRKEEVLDEPLLYQYIGELIQHKLKEENIFECLKKLDLSLVLKQAPGLDQRYPCSFFMNRYAWISKSDDGHYRYFSKIKNGTGVYSFDVFDLLGIFRNETSKQVLNFIRRTWKLSGLTKWHIEQHQKYTDNESFVQSNPIDGWGNLHRLVGKYWYILEGVNSYAMDKVTGRYFSREGESLFFLSNQYLKEHVFPKHSVSTLNNFINLFCVLGLLKKIPLDEIPEGILKKTKKEMIRLKRKNSISFYTVPHFESVLETADHRARILLNAKIPYYRLTKQNVLTLFGEQLSNEVYVQHTFGNKSKKDPIYFKERDVYTERERLEDLFVKELITTGKCEKNYLKSKSLLPAYRFNPLWKTYVDRYGCEEKKPTDLEMQHYGMENRYLIAVKQLRVEVLSTIREEYRVAV